MRDASQERTENAPCVLMLDLYVERCFTEHVEPPTERWIVTALLYLMLVKGLVLVGQFTYPSRWSGIVKVPDEVARGIRSRVWIDNVELESVVIAVPATRQPIPDFWDHKVWCTGCCSGTRQARDRAENS